MTIDKVLKPYIFEFRDGERILGGEVYAENYKDAERIFNRLKSNGRIVGCKYAETDCGWIAAVVVALCRFFKG